MAELSFVCYTPQNEKISVDGVVSYELSKTAQAPADGLRLTFLSDKKLPCINRVLAYDGDELIFNAKALPRQEYPALYMHARRLAFCLITKQSPILMTVHRQFFCLTGMQGISASNQNCRPFGATHIIRWVRAHRATVR